MFRITVIIGLALGFVWITGCKKEHKRKRVAVPVSSGEQAKPTESAAKDESAEHPARAKEAGEERKGKGRERQAQEEERNAAKEMNTAKGSGPGSPPPPKVGPDLAVGEVGSWEEKWPNGKPMVIREVKKTANGKVVNHGKYTSWHENGQKSREATYLEGKLHGLLTDWDKDGNVTLQANYANGEKIS